MQLKAMSARVLVLAALVAATALGGCATRPVEPDELAAFRERNDPFEPFNRAVFKFNDVVDQTVLRPVAIGYRAVLPSGVRNGIRNFLDNLETPVILVNCLLQGEWQRAGDTTGRFMANTILGLGGLIDVASDAGIPKHDEDFGQTLAVWGVNSGPYVVLPLLGPSTFRDGVGLGVDALIDPFGILGGDQLYGEYDKEGPWVRLAVDNVDWRARNLETIDDLRRTSLDFYATVRSAYRQRRIAEISNGRPDRAGGLESMPPMVDFDSMDKFDSKEPQSAPAPSPQQ